MKGDSILKITDREKIYQQIKVVEAIRTASQYKGNIFPRYGYDTPNYSEILQNRINMSHQVMKLQLRAIRISQPPLIRNINLLQTKNYSNIIKGISNFIRYSDLTAAIKRNPSKANYRIPISYNLNIEITPEQISEKRKSLGTKFNLWLDTNADYVIIILIDILFVYYFYGTKDIQNAAKMGLDFIIEAFVIPKINEPLYSKISDSWNKLKIDYFDKSKK